LTKKYSPSRQGLQTDCRKLLLGPASTRNNAALPTQTLRGDGGGQEQNRQLGEPYLKGWKATDGINQENWRIQASSAKRYFGKKARRRLLPLAEKIMIRKAGGC